MPNNRMDVSPFQVILEGKIFEEQPLGGISRIYQEVLPRICEIDDRVIFSILTSDHLLQMLPQHPQITNYHSKFPVHRLLRPQSVFWQAQDYLRARIQVDSLGFGRNSIWHATYFQLPDWWQGPKVTTVYDLIHEKFPYFFNKNYDNIFRKRKKRAILAADRVICISESVRAEVLEMYGLPQEHAVAIPLAYGENFREMTREEIPPDFLVELPFILYVGARSHYKNFKTLLSAYAAWPRRKEVSLIVVGNPWSKEEQEEINVAGLEGNVVCRTGTSDEALCALYNQALAFVYPSLAEGFGIPLLEAMACGCSIVASRIPIFMEVARDVPYFFDPLSRDELIAALEVACYSEAKKSRREEVLANYSWDHSARAILKIYEELALCF